MTPDTLAPSEKHMEDWIVANPACLNTPYTSAKILARQLTLPSGIADLLVFHQHWITVVELKKDEINSKSLAQLLRYIHDLRHVAHEIYLNTFYDNRSRYYGYGSLINPDQTIGGLLIGHRVTDDNLFVSAWAGGVDIQTYSCEGDGYSIQRAGSMQAQLEFLQRKQFDTLPHSNIGKALRSIMIARVVTK